MLLKKLIIAEDDTDVAFLISSALGDAGFLCLRATNGEEALSLARTELPDALVLDVMMPKMDGIEVCRRIKADVLLSRIPILMLTALADVKDRVNGLEAGADDYLPKPFDIRELTARVKALIRASRRERDRNPVTDLPSGEAIEERVHRLIGDKQAFSVLYIDLENFRSFFDVHGYRRADEVVRTTGQIILQKAREAADPPPFVGHVGGDDFVVICDVELTDTLRSTIVESFLNQVESFYSEEDRERGHLVLPGEVGEFRQVSFMTPSVAVVNAEPGQYPDTDALARSMTLAKMRSRRRTRSGAFTPPPEDDNA